MHPTIAVISDIHGNSLALRAVLSDIESRNVKQIYNLGDSLFGPLNLLETYHILASNKNILSIRGNGDRMLLSAINAEDSITLKNNKELLTPTHHLWIEQQPVMIKQDGYLFCHGSPDNDEFYLLEKMSATGGILRPVDEIENVLKNVAEQVIFCGHSHIPRLLHTSNGKIVINPGSVGLPAYEDQLPVKHKMESGSPHARYTIVKRSDGGTITAEFICVPYHWQEAADQAALNGRADWAQALKTGRV